MMDIREIKESELDDLLGLYEHIHDSDDPLPEMSVVESIWRKINENPNFRYFGVFIDGCLTSSCTLSVIPNLTRGCKPYGVIENVVTHTNYRRIGYASILLRYTLDYAWRENCYKVMLLTGRKSEAVFRLYESLGFDRNAKQAFLAKPG